MPEKERALIEKKAGLWGLAVGDYVRGVLRGHLPPIGGIRSRGLDRLRRKRGADPEEHLVVTAETARQEARRGRCAVCQDHILYSAVHQLREDGYSYTEIARIWRLSSRTVEHHEPHRLLLAPSPSGQQGCAVCRLGPEWAALILDARRQEKSVRALAAAAGVSRSAMRWHLRDCVPAALGLDRPSPPSSGLFRPRAVITALNRLDRTQGRFVRRGLE